MSFPQNTPENFPSSRQLGGGFLSQLRQKFAARTFALVIMSIAPYQAAQASLNPQYGGHEFNAHSFIIPDVSEEGNESVWEQWCDRDDSSQWSLTAYIEKISWGWDEIENLKCLLGDYIKTWGNIQIIINVLKELEWRGELEEDFIFPIISVIIDSYYFSHQIWWDDDQCDDVEYYYEKFLPLRNSILEKYPILKILVPTIMKGSLLQEGVK